MWIFGLPRNLSSTYTNLIALWLSRLFPNDDFTYRELYQSHSTKLDWVSWVWSGNSQPSEPRHFQTLLVKRLTMIACISNLFRVCPQWGHRGREKLGGKREKQAWHIYSTGIRQVFHVIFLSFFFRSRGAKPPRFFINSYWPMAELVLGKRGNEIQISWQDPFSEQILWPVGSQSSKVKTWLLVIENKLRSGRCGAEVEIAACGRDQGRFYKLCGGHWGESHSGL